LRHSSGSLVARGFRSVLFEEMLEGDDEWHGSELGEREAMQLLVRTPRLTRSFTDTLRRRRIDGEGGTPWSEGHAPMNDEPLLEEFYELDESHVAVGENASTTLQGTFNSINVLAGVGTLSLPFAFRETGWLAGISLLMYLFGMTNFTGKLIGRCMAKESKIRTFGDLGQFAFGRKGRFFMTGVFCLELIAALAMFITLMGDNLSKLFSASISSKMMYIFSTMAVLPTCWTSRLEILSNLSIIGIVSAMMLLVALLEVGFTSERGKVNGGSFFSIDWGNFRSTTSLEQFPYAIGLQTVGFAGHSCFPSIYTSLKDKNDFPVVIDRAYFVTTVLYLTMGLCGYLLFTKHTQEELTMNLFDVAPGDLLVWLTLIATIVNPFTKFALTLNPVGVLAEQSLLKRVRQGFRKSLSIFLRSTIALIALLLSLSVPGFAAICAFVGAFCSFVVSLIFPVVCYLRMFRHRLSKLFKLFLWTLTLFNIFLCILGTAAVFVEVTF